MKSGMRKGLIVAAIHLCLVGSVGAKLLIDRAIRPRVWARTAPVDPDLPIRGRYVQLRLEGRPAQALPPGDGSTPVTLAVIDGGLTFDPTGRPEFLNGLSVRPAMRDGVQVARLEQPLAYFIPERVPDPSIRAAGEELWAEVTIPKSGPPRPIRLGVKKDGVLTPLQ